MGQSPGATFVLLDAVFAGAFRLVCWVSPSGTRRAAVTVNAASVILKPLNIHALPEHVEKEFGLSIAAGRKQKTPFSAACLAHTRGPEEAAAGRGPAPHLAIVETGVFRYTSLVEHNR